MVITVYKCTLNYYFNNWHILLFTGAKKVYYDLANITKNLEELKNLQSNLSVRITDINKNLTSACQTTPPPPDCPQLPDLSNNFTAVSCVHVKELQ